MSDNTLDPRATPGSTMTPDRVLTPAVTATQVDTDNLILGGRSVEDVTDDPDLMDPKVVPSSAALGRLARGVQRDVAVLRNQVESYRYTSVISDPIISPSFTDDRWLYDGFIFDLGKAIYIARNHNDPQAYLRIPPGQFLYQGRYFVDIEVETLESGILDLVDQEGRVLRTITLAGSVKLEYIVEDTNVAYLELRVRGMQDGHTTVIAAFYVYHVKPSMDQYITYISDRIISGGSGLASMTYVQQQISAAINQAQQYANQLLAGAGDSMTTHIGNHDNPHLTTYEQTGAAAKVHGHTPDQCGAAPTVHGHTPDQCGAAPTVHGHTPEQCGAAPKVHGHTPQECGAAPEVHVHNLSQVVDTNTLYVAMEQKDAVIQGNVNKVAADLAVTNDDLKRHKEDTQNPHIVTKTQTGLGLVENYPPATSQEAIDGVLTNRYMTPAVDRAALMRATQEMILDPSKLQRVPIYRFTLDDYSRTVPLQYDRTYRICIDALHSDQLKNVGLYINEIGYNPQYRNSYCVAQAATGTMAWVHRNLPYFQLTDASGGLNGGYIELSLDTKTMVMSGLLDGRVLGVGGFYDQLDYSIPSIYSGSVPLKAIGGGSEDVPIHLIFQPMIDVVLGINIQIYELVDVLQEPVMVVDATPVGIMATIAGTQPPLGWMLRDGAETTRALYGDLWTFAQDRGLVTDEWTWQNEVATQGYTDRFSSGDGNATFRIPKARQSELTAPYSRPVIKGKPAQVPGGQDMLYKLIWDN